MFRLTFSAQDTKNMIRNVLRKNKENIPQNVTIVFCLKKISQYYSFIIS